MLSPAQLQLLTAFKTALAVIIALGIAMALNWERPYWTGITAMIVFLPYVGAALEKCLLRILGTVAAGVGAYLLTGFFEQEQFWMTIALFVLLVGTGYGAMGKVYPYFFMLGGITLCIIVGQTVEYPERLWHLVLYRTLEVGLGVVVAMAVNSLVFPQRASNALRHKVSETLTDCRDLMLIAAEHYMDDAPLPEGLDDKEQKIAAKFPGLVALMNSALRDSSRLLNHQRAAEEMIRETRQCFVATVTSLRASASEVQRKLQSEMKDELRSYVDALLKDLNHVIDDLSADRPVRKLVDCHEARDALESKVIQLRASGKTFSYPLEDVSNFFAFIGDLDSLREAMVRLAVADRTLYRDVEASEMPDRVVCEPREWRMDIRRLQHGIKVGIACLVSLYAYLWLQWPSGATAFVTAAIVIQVSISASNHKSMLRLGGCLLGGVCGAFTLGFLESHFETYEAYAIPLFAIFFLFAWINNGPQKYAYAGFQAHLAFLLMTTISPEQSVDLEAGFQRFMGILLGVFIAAVVQRLIWPVIPEREFRHDIALFFERGTTFLHDQDARIAHQQTEGEARDQEKELAGIEYLPAKTLDWLGQIGFTDREEEEKHQFTQTFLHVQSIAFALRGMAQANARQLHPEVLAGIKDELVTLDHALADALDRCHAAFVDNERFEAGAGLHDAVLKLEARLTELSRVKHATRALTGQELGSFLALVRRYRELTSLISACEKHTAQLNFKALERTEFF
ncbi:MAG: FUSC family protein [Verrucomicrobiota bacterium]